MVGGRKQPQIRVSDKIYVLIAVPPATFLLLRCSKVAQADLDRSICGKRHFRATRNNVGISRPAGAIETENRPCRPIKRPMALPSNPKPIPPEISRGPKLLFVAPVGIW